MLRLGPLVVLWRSGQPGHVISIRTRKVTTYRPSLQACFARGVCITPDRTYMYMLLGSKPVAVQVILPEGPQPPTGP